MVNNKKKNITDIWPSGWKIIFPSYTSGLGQLSSLQLGYN